MHPFARAAYCRVVEIDDFGATQHVHHCRAADQRSERAGDKPLKKDQCAVHGPGRYLRSGGTGRAGCFEHELDFLVQLIGAVVTLAVEADIQ